MGEAIIIVGGGIAGISCLEALIHEFKQDTNSYKRIILISESRLIKRVRNFNVRGRNMETFDVVETDTNDTRDLHIPDGLNVEFVIGTVNSVNTEKKTITITDPGDQTQSSLEYHYDILSICTGARPKELDVPGLDNPVIQKRIVTIRDTTSVENLRAKLVSCRRIAIIGNGGISLGLVDKISGCEKIWIARDEFMGHPFLDSEASKFFTRLLARPKKSNHPTSRSDDKHPHLSRAKPGSFGPAIGPDWLGQGDFIGNGDSNGDLTIMYNCQIGALISKENSDWPVSIELTDGRVIECDLIVTAIGVVPNCPEFLDASVELSISDGGIIIDEQMRTSIESIYAAGDVVSCEKWPTNLLWFQMRLWTQARQMGFYCGRCIASHLSRTDPTIYSNFDCFTHTTEFFGKKVVLLGRYNAQDMDNDMTRELEIVARIRPGLDYVRLTLKSEVVISAILVGDTNLEETIENLIHDGIDVSRIKDQLLDDTVDIEDYFD